MTRNALLETRKADQPPIAPFIDRLWKQVNEREEPSPDDRIQQLALQRDAIGFNLDIA